MVYRKQFNICYLLQQCLSQNMKYLCIHQNNTPILKVFKLKHAQSFSFGHDPLFLFTAPSKCYRFLMIRTTSKKISSGAFPVSYYSSNVCLFLCVSYASCTSHQNLFLLFLSGNPFRVPAF